MFELKYALPVVVAPPDIVRPPVAVPLPIVEDASEYIPLVNPMSVDVEFAFVEPNRVLVNGKADAVNVLLPIQVPAIAKHPAVRFIPPAVENVEVAVEKFIPPVFPTESIELGEVVPRPKNPFLFIVIAEIVDVARESDEVAINRLPLFDENTQCFRFVCAAISVRAS